MSRCPVCKTECLESSICSECGFEDLAPVFLSKEDGEAWIKNVVWPWRREYWATLNDFEIIDKTVVQYHGQVADVVVPYGIEIIGEEAFQKHKSIKNVFLPETVKVIECRAFEWSSIETIELSHCLERIAVDAFASSCLMHIAIPGSCKVIETMAFSYCDGLQSAILLQGVTRLESFVFHCCPELNHISIPKSVVDIEQAALTTFCPSTRVVVDPRNPRYYTTGNCVVDRLSKTLIAGFLDSEGHIKIPEDQEITCIGAWAFGGQRTEYVVTIPKNIQEIGDSAFAYIEDWDKVTTSIVIPLSVELMRQHPFDGTYGDIFCMASQKPEGWDDDWAGNSSNVLRSIKNVYWHDEWNNCPNMPHPVRNDAEDLPF